MQIYVTEESFFATAKNQSPKAAMLSALRRALPIIENQIGDFAAASNVNSTFTGTLIVDAGFFALNGSCGDVRVNGGILQPSTETGRSLRGAVTLNTPSATLHVPGSPVSCAMRFVSSAPFAVSGSETAMASA